MKLNLFFDIVSLDDKYIFFALFILLFLFLLYSIAI